MERRTFLQSTSVIVAGSLFTTLFACKDKIMEEVAAARTNWAGNLTYSTDKLYEPSNEAELLEHLKKVDHSKALGSCHSFNKVADSRYSQISLEKMEKVMEINAAESTVRVSAGIRYGELAKHLHENGFALHNLASLPHISIAGACATATHGSGDSNGNLPSIVREVELINAAGEKVILKKGVDPDFEGAVVGLGALGLITHLKLEIQPDFEVRQDIYLDLPIASMEENFDEIYAMGYSVSLFTDWVNGTVNQVWLKNRVGDGELNLPDDLFGAKAADRNVHPILEISPENCTDQMGVAGPWHERLPHFKMDFTPSKGDELQSEFFVPRTYAVEALKAVYAMGEKIYPVLLISEIRSIAADDLWMSPCYQEACIALHFTWKPQTKEVMELLPQLEDALRPYRVRPHWGKLFTVSKEYLEGIYTKMRDFRALIDKHDPDRKFSNEFLEKLVYEGEV